MLELQIAPFLKRFVALLYYANPPATTMLVPVMYEASSLSKKATAATTSSTSPNRFRGTPATLAAATSQAHNASNQIRRHATQNMLARILHARKKYKYQFLLPKTHTCTGSRLKYGDPLAAWSWFCRAHM